MQVRLLKECSGPDGKHHVGEHITHPESWQLCLLGMAEPIDEEAKLKVQNAKNGGLENNEEYGNATEAFELQQREIEATKAEGERQRRKIEELEAKIKQLEQENQQAVPLSVMDMEDEG